VDPDAYDAWFETRIGREVFRRQLRHLIGMLEGCESLLDLGCGTGLFTRALAEALGVDFTACVEVDPEMAERAKERVDEVIVGDASSTPFDDGSFDAVLMNNVLEFAEDPSGIVDEARRVAGDRVVAVTLNPRSPWNVWRRLKGRLGHPWWSAARFPRLSDLRRWGLSPVRFGVVVVPPLVLPERLEGTRMAVVLGAQVFSVGEPGD